ncbi:MAG: prephenate dehydrogenase/arogenate dehydrogenase family protein [Dehalococcoidia bacterium]|nr:prephenate dehydrogenase/arogenate dehydrogenase family protein [Dehalococcoidia bacterium]
MARRITIIGLGLIGGSIGLALKKAGPEAVELVGYARRMETAERARQMGAIDRVEGSLPSAVGNADLVVLATPTMSIKEILPQIGPHLPDGCAVTDVASTKVDVMRWAEESLPQNVSFVGGHPMAGKELSGIEAADGDLFKGCTYCVVPGRNASEAAMAEVIDLAHRIGARHVLLDAAEHDWLVAGISHLPLILASALVMATTQSPQWSKMSALAATGYQSATRLASQHPRMNRDICFTNRSNIIAWIDEFARELERFRRLVAERDVSLEEAFEKARQARTAWIEEHGKKS